MIKEKHIIPETEEIWRSNLQGVRENGLKYGRAQKIGVVGISRKAGATFATVSLAKFIAGRGIPVTVVDFGNHEIYRSIAEKEQKEKIEKRKAERSRICWIPKEENVHREMTEEADQIQKIYSIMTQVAIYDFSESCEEKNFGARLAAMDFLITIVDPMPYAMMQGLKLMKRIKKSNVPYQTVINKYEKGIQKKELQNFIEEKDLEWIPNIPINFLYKAEYEGKLTFEVREINEVIENSMKRILLKLTGKGLYL